ncbi:hypothetical protein [Burkholderia diffusa]|nr:hypothetical protein [Burkholderia diffusa]
MKIETGTAALGRSCINAGRFGQALSPAPSPRTARDRTLPQMIQIEVNFK